MIVYRHRSRSNEIVDPSQFTPGRIVWFGFESKHREMRICTEPHGACVTLEGWRKLKEERAARNRAAHPYKRTQMRSDHGGVSLWM